tara:strand:+ start:85 stop:339 length:255 start_codon:yes stop_codon:yes gene_type:complete
MNRKTISNMIKDRIVSILTDYKKPIQKDTLVDILIRERFPNHTKEDIIWTKEVVRTGFHCTNLKDNGILDNNGKRNAAARWWIK